MPKKTRRTNRLVSRLALALVQLLRGRRQVKMLHVMDGDTYLGVDTSGRKFKMRLRGIDCPEVGQELAEDATLAVRQWMQGQWVDVKFAGKDRYGRWVVDITLPKGEDLAESLLHHGLAFPLPGKFSWTAWKARLSRRGLWKLRRRKMPWQAAARRRGLIGWWFRRQRGRR